MFYISYAQEEQRTLRKCPQNYYIVYSLLKEKVDFATGYTSEKFPTKDCDIVRSLEIEGVHLTRNQVHKVIEQLVKIGLIQRTETLGIYYLPFIEMCPKKKAPPKAQQQAPAKATQDKGEETQGNHISHPTSHQNESEGTVESPFDTYSQDDSASPSVSLPLPESIPKTHSKENGVFSSGIASQNPNSLSPSERTYGSSPDFDKPQSQDSTPFSENLPFKTESSQVQDMVKRFEALIRENGSLDYPSSSVSRRHYQIWANAGVAEKQVQKAIKKIKDSGQLSATPADITKMLETMRAKAVRPSGQRSDGLVL